MYTFYFKLKKSVKNYLNRKKILNRNVRRSMFRFLEYKHKWKYIETISSVETKKKKDHVHVTITLYRPGLLIGKRGWFIGALKDHLIDELNTNIEIDLRENKVWSFNLNH